jgi:hypothetical protein
MKRRYPGWHTAVLLLLCAWPAMAAADECCLNMSRPACGKVCKLVRETKKLTAIGYGSECKSICIPDPSWAGCKHCAVCSGKCAGDACGECQSCPPKCEFCWRDWFACGCAQPRTVRVLTKYQAEKKICWYHWEVVDAACCDCDSQIEPAKAGDKKAAKDAARSIYKPAPENAQLGEVIPVSDEEGLKLAALLSTVPAEVEGTASAASTPAAAGKASDEMTSINRVSKAPTAVERVQQLLRK